MPFMMLNEDENAYSEMNLPFSKGVGDLNFSCSVIGGASYATWQSLFPSLSS